MHLPTYAYMCSKNMKREEQSLSRYRSIDLLSKLSDAAFFCMHLTKSRKSSSQQKCTMYYKSLGSFWNVQRCFLNSQTGQTFFLLFFLLHHGCCIQEFLLMMMMMMMIAVVLLNVCHALICQTWIPCFLV